MWQRLIPLLALGAPAWADSPIAEVICATRAEIVARLQGATVSGSGLRDADAVLEVWAKAPGDWVLVPMAPLVFWRWVRRGKLSPHRRRKRQSQVA